MKNFIERVVFVGIAVPLLFALILYVPHYNHAPIGIVHSTRTFAEPAVLIDIFSPPRDDLR